MTASGGASAPAIVAARLAVPRAGVYAVAARPLQPARPADSTDLDAVERAVAAYTRDQYAAGGPLGLDERAPVRGFQSYTGGLKRAATRSARLAAILGAVLVDGDTIVTCAGAPSTCRMRGVDRLVRLSQPTIAGDSAVCTVVYTRYLPHPRVPLFTATRDVVVRRVAGAWKAFPSRYEART